MQAINQLVLDENNIAFHPMMGNSYQLNDISKEIITLLRDGKSKQEVVSVLSERYDVSYNELFIDVSDFFSKLKVYGLIT
ncbi:MAG: PqqD family protein [Sulfurimonas sp.]|nr:PqqD family protein [Sulfurimonas sp.]